MRAASGCTRDAAAAAAELTIAVDELAAIGAVRVAFMLDERGRARTSLGDLALRRLVEPPEPHFELVGLILVEDLQAHDLLGLPIARHVETAHGARDRFAQNLVAATDVDATPFDERFEKSGEAHGR